MILITYLLNHLPLPMIRVLEKNVRYLLNWVKCRVFNELPHDPDHLRIKPPPPAY